MKNKLYAVMVAGGAMGLVASFLQSIEKIALLKHQNAALSCDLNSVFSCSNVLNAPQSAVFGFPNSFMCMVLFTIFTTEGLVLLTGGHVSRGFRLFTQGLSLFTLGFALWFLWQSTYRIGSLCIFCMFCFAGLLMVNAAWLRMNSSDLPISARAHRMLAGLMLRGADIFVWILLAVVVAGAMVLHFR